MKNTAKNIAFVLPSLGMGGAERVASELANEFVKNGINTSIILLDNNEICYELDENIDIHFIEYDKNQNTIKRNLQRIKKLRNLLVEKQIDSVISFVTSADFLAVLATRNIKTKVYVSERSDPSKSSKKISMIRNFLYKRADGVIFQTKEAMEYFPKKIQKKGKIIWNPVKSNLPRWDSVNEHKKVIVTACRLEESKNIPMLIDAFEKVKKIHKDYELVIFGNGAEKDNIQAKIKQLGLEESVFLKGRNNHWHDEAIQFSIFVLSSNYEGMSNSLLEALAMGIPVISTDHPVGGAREVIRNQENGFLIKVNDTDELYTRLIELIENENLQKKFSNESKKVIQEMNIKVIAKKWLKFVSDIE